jgi:ankyrin repeat protein
MITIKKALNVTTLLLYTLSTAFFMQCNAMEAPRKRKTQQLLNLERTWRVLKQISKGDIPKSALENLPKEYATLLADANFDSDIAFINAARQNIISKDEIDDFLESKLIGINNQDSGKKTLLHLAINHNDPLLFELLLKYKADVNIADREGKTPLNYAVQYGYQDFIQPLIDAGADINHADNLGNTPLITAAEYKNSDILRLLLANKANTNSANEKGENPLIITLLHNRGNVEDDVDALLAAGADVNHAAYTNNTSDDALTPLMIATIKRKPALIDKLKKHGALERC